jgi:hypothetical protein
MAEKLVRITLHLWSGPNQAVVRSLNELALIWLDAVGAINGFLGDLLHSLRYGSERFLGTVQVLDLLVLWVNFRCRE